MRHTWKKTAAFLLAFTLVAAPLSQTGVKGGLFGNIGIVAHAEDVIWNNGTIINTDTVINGNVSVSSGAEVVIAGNAVVIINGDLTLQPGFWEQDDFDGDWVSTDIDVFTGNSPLLIINGNLNLGSHSCLNGCRKPHFFVTGSISGNGTCYNNETFTTSLQNISFTRVTDGTSYFTDGNGKKYVLNGSSFVPMVETVDISTATVTLGADNSVSSITVGDDTITDLSGFDITYGVSDTDHTATSVPTDAGTYYAYVTPKSGNETYIGTAKSDSFTVTVPLTGSGTQEDPYLINSLVELATYANVDEYAAGSYIQLTADLVCDGDFLVTKSSHIMLNGHTFTSGSFTVNNDVEVAVNGGIINAPITNNGLVIVLGGTVNGAITNNNVFLIDNGTISDAITNNGNINMFGGTVSGNITCSDQIHVFGGTISGDIDISETGILRAVKKADVNNGAPTFNGVISNSGSTVISYGTFANDPSTINNVEIPEGYYVKTVTENDTTVYQVLQKLPKISSASVTINDGFGLNFYVDDITDAAGYTVMFDGACDENGTQVALTEKDGKFFATANVNAKDFKENITATVYKDGVATDVTFTSSVDAYLTALLATDGLDDKTKAMATSAQLYGLAADEYFNETDNSVAAKLTAYMTAAGIDDTALSAALTPYAPSYTSDDAKVSMVLNSKIKLRVYSDNGASENGFGKYSEAAGLTPLTLAQPQAIDGFTVSGYTWVYRVLNNTASEAKDVNMAKALFAYMSAAEALNAPANPYADKSLGDVVTFGNYNWYIIGKSDNGVTLLMKDNLEIRKYNDSDTDVTWETCSLRTYLNGDFYNSFSDEDKAKIVSTHNSNPNNPDFNTSGGNETDDYIYLLSIYEANALDDINSSIRTNDSWWWLRSPGCDSEFAAFVYEDGGVETGGNYVDYENVVRPALNLEF